MVDDWLFEKHAEASSARQNLKDLFGVGKRSELFLEGPLL